MLSIGTDNFYTHTYTHSLSHTKSLLHIFSFMFCQTHSLICLSYTFSCIQCLSYTLSWTQCRSYTLSCIQCLSYTLSWTQCLSYTLYCIHCLSKHPYAIVHILKQLNARLPKIFFLSQFIILFAISLLFCKTKKRDQAVAMFKVSESATRGSLFDRLRHFHFRYMLWCFGRWRRRCHLNKFKDGGGPGQWLWLSW